MPYQSFDGEKGDSASGEKLKAIALPDDLTGKSVLDIGCNEGFFCSAALARGASRVVGIDMSGDLIERAKKRVPDAEFRRESWWDIGGERFDYILFLSAIHYEPRQKALLRKLLDNLKPGGTLILEGGAVLDYQRRDWKWVPRHDGLVRFPTVALLFDELMPDYSVRLIGNSVMQSGDPQHRFVFHAQRKSPTIFCISGPSRAGKSSFARLFADSSARIIHLDPVLGDFTHLPEGNRQGFVDQIRTVMKAVNFDVYQFVAKLEENNLLGELAKFVFRLVVADDNLTIIEGYPFTKQEFTSSFRKIAEQNGFRVVMAEL